MVNPFTTNPVTSSCGWVGKVVSGVITPASSAAAAVSTFMIEPGTYTPFRARLTSGRPGSSWRASHGPSAAAGSPLMAVASKVGLDGHGQDLAGGRVEGHHGPHRSAQLGGGEGLQPMVDGQHQVVWLGRALEDVVHHVMQRVRVAEADQQLVPRALDAGRAVAQRRVPEQMAWRPRRGTCDARGRR